MMPVLVIGIGNADRGDDAAGLLAVRAIRTADPAIPVGESRGEPAALIDAWRGAEAVYLVDCCTASRQSGTVHRFAAHEAPLPEQLGAVSSHGIGLGTTIELARALDALPGSLIVFAIEGACFDAGVPPSAVVTRAAGQAALRIRKEIAQISSGRMMASS
jgi:hydrogenase maturation protease